MANSSSRKIWRSSFFVVLLAALAALCAPAARAQTPTLVTGTIVGADGVPWTGAQLTGVLIYAGNAGSPRLTPCTNNTSGCPIQQAVPPPRSGPAARFKGSRSIPTQTFCRPRALTPSRSQATASRRHSALARKAAPPQP